MMKGQLFIVGALIFITFFLLFKAVMFSSVQYTQIPTHDYLEELKEEFERIGLFSSNYVDYNNKVENFTKFLQSKFNEMNYDFYDLWINFYWEKTNPSKIFVTVGNYFNESKTVYVSNNSLSPETLLFSIPSSETQTQEFSITSKDDIQFNLTIDNQTYLINFNSSMNWLTFFDLNQYSEIFYSRKIFITYGENKEMMTG